MTVSRIGPRSGIKAEIFHLFQLTAHWQDAKIVKMHHWFLDNWQGTPCCWWEAHTTSGPSNKWRIPNFHVTPADYLWEHWLNVAALKGGRYSVFNYSEWSVLILCFMLQNGASPDHPCCNVKIPPRREKCTVIIAKAPPCTRLGAEKQD